MTVKLIMTWEMSLFILWESQNWCTDGLVGGKLWFAYALATNLEYVWTCPSVQREMVAAIFQCHWNLPGGIYHALQLKETWRHHFHAEPRKISFEDAEGGLALGDAKP